LGRKMPSMTEPVNSTMRERRNANMRALTDKAVVVGDLKHLSTVAIEGRGEAVVRLERRRQLIVGECRRRVRVDASARKPVVSRQILVQVDDDVEDYTSALARCGVDPAPLGYIQLP
jgi:hypothetical protein